MFLIKKWITGSVTDTKDQVIIEILKPDELRPDGSVKPSVSKRLKAAMDIPDSKALVDLESRIQGQIQGLQDTISARVDNAIHSLDVRVQGVDASVQAVEAEVKAEIQAIGKKPVVLADETIKDLAGSLRGYAGKEGQNLSREADAFIQKYSQDPQAWQRDAPAIYQAVTSGGVAPNMAKAAIMDGPSAVANVLGTVLGKKAGNALGDLIRGLEYLQKLKR